MRNSLPNYYKKMKTPPLKRELSFYRILKYPCLTFSITSIFCSSLMASPGMAQRLDKSRINIKISKGQQLEAILHKMENLSGLSFVYNPDLLQERNTVVSGNFKTESVRSLLNKLGISAVEKDGHIILTTQANIKADRIITGVVRDTLGSAIAGVSVKVVGTQVGTTTDAKGSFRIEAGSQSVLSFSMIGFRSKEVVVGDNEVINVTLSEERSTLSEVVVVGYGTQKKETLTGAVSVVSLDKLSSRSVNSVGEVLAGKSPGVIVTNEGGDPTSPPRINIRGAGGINGENVLYVIDG
ncbi:MAG: carboxypeptidase-like regulatory domain-containing protein, partial [Sphingobacterium sp.]